MMARARGVALAGVLVLSLTAGGSPPPPATDLPTCATLGARTGAWVCMDEPTDRLSPAVGGWCEYGKSCEGHHGAYIHWYKTPAAYGDDDYVIGTFDVVQKVSLKGRTPYYAITLIHKGRGDPALKFFDSVVRCSEDDFIGDKNCGDHYIPDRRIAPGKRIVTDEERGNRLDNRDDYFSVYYTKFKAAGYTRTWTTRGLKSKEWYCPTGDRKCYFPGQR